MRNMKELQIGKEDIWDGLIYIYLWDDGKLGMSYTGPYAGDLASIEEGFLTVFECQDCSMVRLIDCEGNGTRLAFAKKYAGNVRYHHI